MQDVTLWWANLDKWELSRWRSLPPYKFVCSHQTGADSLLDTRLLQYRYSWSLCWSHRWNLPRERFLQPLVQYIVFLLQMTTMQQWELKPGVHQITVFEEELLQIFYVRSCHKRKCLYQRISFHIHQRLWAPHSYSRTNLLCSSNSLNTEVGICMNRHCHIFHTSSEGPSRNSTSTRKNSVNAFLWYHNVPKSVYVYEPPYQACLNSLE